MAGRDGGNTFDGTSITRASRGPRVVSGRGEPKRLYDGPSGFFGPGTALAPAAQSEQGRAYDYPFGFNTSIQPRAYEPVDFPTLRLLADNLDVLRLAIETRKDQMGKLQWTIRKKGAEGEDQDATAKQIEDFLQLPDQEHDFGDWVRMLYEDLLVIDGASVYIRRTRGGKPYTLEVIDGGTITRKLDERGRTPQPPATAYQQIIKGMAMADYTMNDLVYKPRNPRPNKAYGFGPVEQIVMTINIAIRKAVFQLKSFTDGNMPPALVSVPTDWSPQTIREMQRLFDEQNAGDLGARHQLRFVPGGMKVDRLHTDPLFDLGDEWLARVICYAYSLPPNAFVKQMNRATATTAQEVALEEGLAPLMEWQKRFMDRLIRLAFATSDYEFVWQDAQDVDPEVQAKLDDLYIRNGTRTPASVAEDHGWEKPPEPPAPIAPPGEPPINGAAAAGTTDQKATQEPGAPSGAAKLVKARARSRPY